MTISEKVIRAKADYDAVYNAGFEKGKAEGGDTESAFEAGKKAEYDEFWDAYQDNGNRKSYYGAFAGSGWTDESLKPKYNIVPTTASRMFSSTGIKDLKKALEDANVILDFSKVTACSYLANDNSKIERIPTLDTTSLKEMGYFFHNCPNLEYIEKIILKNDGSQKFTSSYSFGTCPKLKEIRFEGVIGTSDFNISTAKGLSKESIISIINALSTTTSGLSITLSATAVNNAFATAEEASDGSASAEWLALIGTKSNWTISLV